MLQEIRQLQSTRVPLTSQQELHMTYIRLTVICLQYLPCSQSLGCHWIPVSLCPITWNMGESHAPFRLHPKKPWGNRRSVLHLTEKQSGSLEIIFFNPLVTGDVFICHLVGLKRPFRVLHPQPGTGMPFSCRILPSFRHYSMEKHHWSL